MSEIKYPYAIRVGDVTVRTPPVGELYAWVFEKMRIEEPATALLVAQGIGIGIAFDIATEANKATTTKPISQALPVDE